MCNTPGTMRNFCYGTSRPDEMRDGTIERGKTSLGNRRIGAPQISSLGKPSNSQHKQFSIYSMLPPSSWWCRRLLKGSRSSSPSTSPFVLGGSQTLEFVLGTSSGWRSIALVGSLRVGSSNISESWVLANFRKPFIGPQSVLIIYHVLKASLQHP